MVKNRHSARWVGAILDWFAREHRDMPWRRNPEPYAVWVSEIMLQQTQVATVIPYFNRFMRRFPTVRRLAAASDHDVMKLWEGLGYYSRARNLHRAAKDVVRGRGGRLPVRFEEWLELPGIGEYTAAAIASIAFGEATPVVDGNVVRVFTRFLGIEEDSARPAVREKIRGYLAGHIPAKQPGDFNQAMMELGAVTCRPRNPECGRCPLSRECVARREGRTAELPVRRKKKAVPLYDAVVGIIRHKGRILIAKRRADQMLGGLWEFPGGKPVKGESFEGALRREIREETGLQVKVGEEVCLVRHAYSHFRIRLHAFECTVVRGHARAIESDEVRWVAPAGLAAFPFPAANRRVLEQMRK